MVAVNYDWDEVEDNVDEEYEDSGNTVAEYTTEPFTFGDMISQRREGESAFFHFDGQGSTLALTDLQSNVSATYSYTAFGAVTEQAGASYTSWRYLGRRGYAWCSDSNGYCVRRRPLDAHAGRWLTHDPIPPTGAIVDYRYVANRPTARVDPSGLFCIEDRSWECAVDTDIHNCGKFLSAMRTNEYVKMLLECAMRRGCVRSCNPIICEYCEDATAYYEHPGVIFGPHIRLCYNNWTKLSQTERFYLLYEELYHSLTICHRYWDREHPDRALYQLAEWFREPPNDEWPPTGYDRCASCYGREVLAKACAKMVMGQDATIARLLAEASSSCSTKCDPNRFTPESSEYKIINYWFENVVRDACSRINSACDTRDRTLE